MTKTGINKFMDFLKLSDSDDDLEEDDLFDDEEELYEQPRRKSKNESSQFDDYVNDTPQKKAKPKTSKITGPSKLVSINSRNNNNRSTNKVYVIKPQEFNEAQTVTDYLKEGITIVINMEGIEVTAAQRIIDFIGGACYALDGTLQAISANIFIAAPCNIDVTGNLRNEILNESTLSPDLTMF